MTAVKTYELFPSLSFDLCADCADYGAQSLPLPFDEGHEGVCDACEGRPMQLAMGNGRLSAILAEVEHAVDRHAQLTRQGRESNHRARLHFDDLGWSASIMVRHKKRQGMADVIGRGETPEEAASVVIRSLAYWAEVLAS